MNGLGDKLNLEFLQRLANLKSLVQLKSQQETWLISRLLSLAHPTAPARCCMLALTRNGINSKICSLIQNNLFSWLVICCTVWYTLLKLFSSFLSSFFFMVVIWIPFIKTFLQWSCLKNTVVLQGSWIYQHGMSCCWPLKRIFCMISHSWYSHVTALPKTC